MRIERNGKVFQIPALSPVESLQMTYTPKEGGLTQPLVLEVEMEGRVPSEPSSSSAGETALVRGNVKSEKMPEMAEVPEVEKVNPTVRDVRLKESSVRV